MREHKYLFIFSIILLIVCIIYIYITEHKVSIEDNEWMEAFNKVGISHDDRKYMEHDSDVWFYKGVNTCVGYGDFNDSCNFRFSVCSGIDNDKPVFGDRGEQAREIKRAIDSIKMKGESHPDCPIIYSGTK